MMIGFNQFKTQIQSLGINTSNELANYLLDTYQVALLPGSDFGFETTEFFFRLAFVDFNGEKVMNAYRDIAIIDENFIKENCLRIYTGVQQLIKFTKEVS